jgi:hypothetical protein
MEEYVGAFHEHVRATTGMVGFSMFGGPTPNAGGALTIYVWVSACRAGRHVPNERLQLFFWTKSRRQHLQGLAPGLEGRREL